MNSRPYHTNKAAISDISQKVFTKPQWSVKTIVKRALTRQSRLSTRKLKSNMFLYYKTFELPVIIHLLIFILKLRITDLVFFQVHPTWCLTSLLLARRLDV